MSEDLSRLYKILKDGTRVKILELLENRGSLGYGELLSLSEISNTGRLNYHLKILRDLISKNGEAGRYSLSEKGRLAAEFLTKLQSASSGGDSSLQGVKIPKTPFERGAKILQGLLALEIALIFAFNLYAYLTLPSVVSLHYEFNGRMLSSGPSYIFLLFAGLFNVPQLIFLFLSFARRVVASTPVAATNFPSFNKRLPKINYERRG
jgi:DNA-binding transcriptional ArsR family regulator